MEKHSNINIQVVFASQDSPFDFINKEDIERVQIKWLGYLSKDKLDEVVMYFGRFDRKRK